MFLKPVHKLSPEEQDELIEKVKLEWLKREVQNRIDEADRGEFVDGEEFRIRAEKRLRESLQ
ncbi:MAG: hypothetical protein K2X27_17305 [Candidatus Obscuribacterales bacterium]|nr:hypothetical protein [Candidatus Obscuribacterales bacterium]